MQIRIFLFTRVSVYFNLQLGLLSVNLRVLGVGVGSGAEHKERPGAEPGFGTWPHSVTLAGGVIF